MLTDYEARVLTKCRMNGCEQPYSYRSVAGPAAAIGLILVGILVLTAYERPRGIESGSTGAFNLGPVLPAAITETNGVVP